MAKRGKVGAAVGADLFSLLAQTASPKGEAEKGRIAQSASTERKAEKETKDSRGVGTGKAERGRNDSAACGHKNR